MRVIGSPDIPRTSLLATPGREAALRSWLDAHGTLMAAAESHPQAVALEGRGRVAVVPSPESSAAPGVADGSGGERWVVRHYHRGGSVAALLDDRYLRVGTPRPVRELRMLEVVRERGVPAPEPVGAAVYATGPFYRGDLVTVWVPDSVDLAALLFGTTGSTGTGGARVRDHDENGDLDGDRRHAAVHAAGRLVQLLHERGVEHPDLNLKNILLAPDMRASNDAVPPIDPPPRALILDLDRARLRDGPLPPRARRAMVSRFWRSARKWERRTGRPLSPSLRRAFETGYAAGLG
jgi:3-deoxy-D-manno-octulosonic acid kinase